MRIAFVLFLFQALFLTQFALAETKCLDAEGEAIIVNNDIPSAKAEAISRAKWAAIEQTVGVEVRAQSVVQNLTMVDEAVSRQIQGAVTKYKVLGQNAKDDIMAVQINACVESTRAKDAVAGLALNNAISVFILAKDPKARAEGYEETNILSESLIGKLTDQGYTVVDIGSTHALDGKVIDSTLKSGKLIGLRSLMYKFLTNILLIGKVDYTLSTKKGEDLGYGISMPFNNVRARLTYRLISKNAAGEMIVLAAGTEQGKGLASQIEDAAAESLKDLAENVTPAILEKMEKHIKGVAKRVAVKVIGISELSDSFAVKEVFQNMAWVSKVEEKGLDEFIVSYSENPIYLANSIKLKGNFKIDKFTSDSIVVEYEK